MADHSPLPWRIERSLRDGLIDGDGRVVVRPTADTDATTDLANLRLIRRAVNAVAGTQPGPVDLDVALCLADEALMGDFPAVGEAIQALVGEVVRLRLEIHFNGDREGPVQP